MKRKLKSVGFFINYFFTYIFFNFLFVCPDQPMPGSPPDQLSGAPTRLRGSDPLASGIRALLHKEAGQPEGDHQAPVSYKY